MEQSTDEQGRYEPIVETSLTATKSPTDVWILNDDLEPEEFKSYEQWEQNRRFNAKAVYYHPSGAKFYMKNIDDPFGVNHIDTDAYTPPVLLHAAPVPTSPDQLYTWLAGDNIWQVAQRLQFGPHELLEHNDIDDYNDIVPGTVLHLPQPRPRELRDPIRYEAFATPRRMHVSKTGGAKKWSFGNVRIWKDLTEAGPLQLENTNLTIYGVAYVPMGDDEEAYYMDALSFGRYRTIGRVSYTTGFHKHDLSEGHVFEPPPPPLPDDQVEVIMQSGWDLSRVLLTAGYSETAAHDKTVQGTAVVSRTGVSGQKMRVYKYVEPEPFDEIEPDATPQFHYKSTYQPLPKPTMFIVRETMMVKEFDGRRPDHRLVENTGINIAGTFLYDGREYARPKAVVNQGYWFGIPVENLVTEEDLYNVDLASRSVRGQLSAVERILVITTRIVVQYEGFLDWLNKYLRKTNKEK